MSSLYSTSLKIELIGTGDQTGVWGGTTNTNLGTAIEQAIVGKASLVTGDFTANVATLTLTDTNASQTARAFVLDVTATLSAAGTINVPAVQKPYIVFNNTVGGFALTVKVSGLTGVVVPNGKRMLVYNNGTDVIDGLNYLNGAATSATTATNLAAGVANNIPYQTGAGATSFITAPSISGYVLGWNGTNFIWVAAPASTTAVNLLGGSAGVVPYQSATDTTAFTAVGTSGKALLSAGTGSPTWGNVNLTSAVTGTLPIANGGTNSTATPTAGSVGYGTGTAHGYTAAGTSGQYLQSAGAGVPVWATLTVTGSGGTTGTGNITLTASSPAAMTITPATPGLYVTLPDATTCTKADNLYSVYNAGDYDYGVKDSAGTQLGWIRSRTGAMIGLADNSTAAGTWAYYGLEKLGVTAQYINSTLANVGSAIVRIVLDSNRTCFLFGGTSCYAIVYDASTQTWGSATLVRSGVASGAFVGILSATNQVLVVSNNATTAMEAVTLTISTNTVTVNNATKATFTLAANWGYYSNFISVPAQSAFCIYFVETATASWVKSITVSGTTPTLGTSVRLVAGQVPQPVVLFVSGSILRAVAAGNNITFTVTGSTLTAGTTTPNSVGTNFRALLNGNGNIVVLSAGASFFSASIVKLTGTTEAISLVALSSSVNPAALSASDIVQVTASKTAVVYYASTVWYTNILTDTAGTASAGTEISGTWAGTLAYVSGIAASGNTARFAIGTNAIAGQLAFDCSGASPILSSYQVSRTVASLLGGPLPSDAYGTKSPRVLISDQTMYALSGQTGPYDQQIGTNAISRRIALSVPAVTSGTTAVSGALNESIITGTADGGSTGILLNRVEAAA